MPANRCGGAQACAGDDHEAVHGLLERGMPASRPDVQV